MTANGKVQSSLHVTLSKNGKTKTFYIHRLVAQAFLDDYSEDYVVKHRGDPMNNKVTNLYVVMKPKQEEEDDREWVPVVGYPHYEISMDGKVVNTETRRPLKQYTNNGRKLVKLYVDRRPKNFYVDNLLSQSMAEVYKHERE
jgi:hypothetical protein